MSINNFKELFIFDNIIPDFNFSSGDNILLLSLWIFENKNFSVFWYNLFWHIFIRLYKFDFILVSIKSGINSVSKFVLKKNF